MASQFCVHLCICVPTCTCEVTDAHVHTPVQCVHDDERTHTYITGKNITFKLKICSYVCHSQNRKYGVMYVCVSVQVYALLLSDLDMQ